MIIQPPHLVEAVFYIKIYSVVRDIFAVIGLVIVKI